jgi:hypothetical protein
MGKKILRNNLKEQNKYFEKIIIKNLKKYLEPEIIF